MPIDAQPMIDAQPIEDNSQMESSKSINPVPVFSLPQAATALAAGASSGAASALESVGDAALWATDKLGITDPNISAIAKDAQHQAFNAARTNVPGQPNDAINQAASQYPTAEVIGRYGTEIAATMAGSVGNIFKGAGAASKIGNVAAQAGVNALEGAGVAGPNDQASNLGAGIGAVASLAGSAGGALVNKAVQASLVLGSKLKSYLDPIFGKLAQDPSLTAREMAGKAEASFTGTTMAQDSANYKVIKDIPGVIDGSKIQGTVKDAYLATGAKIDELGMLDTSKSYLDPKQINVFRSIQQDAGNMNNMEDALNLRQYIAQNKTLFQGKGVPTSVYKEYNGIKAQIDSMITQKAEAAGLGDALTVANTFNRHYTQPLYDSGAVDRMNTILKNDQREQIISKLKPGQPVPPVDPDYTKALRETLPLNPTPAHLKEIQSRLGPNGGQIIQNHFLAQTFKDFFANPENFNKNNALIKLNQLTNKYEGVFSPDTVKTVEGAKTLLQQAGAVAKEAGPKNNAYVLHFAGHALGGAAVGGLIGDQSGQQHGREYGAAIGAVAGIAALPKLIEAGGQGFKTLMDTTLGQKLLKYMADNPQAARKFIQSSGIGAAAHFTNTDSGDQ